MLAGEGKCGLNLNRRSMTDFIDFFLIYIVVYKLAVCSALTSVHRSICMANKVNVKAIFSIRIQFEFSVFSLGEPHFSTALGG